jgi:hypothetical protein
MRYELKLSRHTLQATLIVSCHLSRYSWQIQLRHQDRRLSLASPRLYKHAEVALYSALRGFKQQMHQLTEHDQRLLMLWLRQVFDNAWLHVPMTERLALLADDRVMASPALVAQVAAHPVSLEPSTLQVRDNAGMRTRMCPLSLDLPLAS